MMGDWLDLSIENRLFRRETVVLFDGLVLDGFWVTQVPYSWTQICFIGIFDGIFDGIYPQTMG